MSQILKYVLIAAALVAAALVPQSGADTDAANPDRVVTGTLTRDDFRTYIYHDFDMPAGVREIEVALEFSRADGTKIDIGLIDGNGLRGWSGGGQPVFRVGHFAASHGYLAGPLDPGPWQILLAVPYIEQGVSTDYRVTVRFNPPAPRPAGEQKGRWLRGDFHVHTGHGDATCDTMTGTGRSRCPVFRSIEAALEKKLDFFALTDHNTVSQLATIAELQPHFDNIILIPGMEVTTFYGHANAFGINSYIDFRITKTNGGLNRLLDDLTGQGAILSVNHPLLHFGSQCMGCGWDLDTDYSKITAVEAVGGGIFQYFESIENPISGIRFWQNLLNQGHRLTAIGGSDNHDPINTRNSQTPVGIPTTVVWSESFSVEGILNGVKSGRVFIDVAGEPDWKIDLQAKHGSQTVHMGQALAAAPGDTIELTAHIAGPPGAVVEFIDNRSMRTPVAVSPTGDPLNAAAITTVEITSGSLWVRAQLRNAEGNIVLVSNPVYFDLPATDE